MPNNLPKPITTREKFLAKAAGMDVETPKPVTREEHYLEAIAEGGSVESLKDVQIEDPENGEVLKYDAEQGKWINGTASGGGGTSDYTDLTNKPKINDVTLSGNKSLSDLGIADADDVYTKTESDTLFSAKVDKVSGKGLSENDYTTAEKTKLAGIAAGAEVNVQADWAQSDSTADDYIKGKPTIPAAQVNSDWSASSGVAQILHKPTLGAAAAKGVDSAPTASSTNLVESGGVHAALAAKLNTADVDAALSSTSTNPVQNKAVQAPIARLIDVGAKNIFSYGDLIGVTVEFGDKPLVLPKGAYKLIFHESATSGSFAVRIKDASANSIFYVTGSNANADHAYDVEISVDGATITIYSSVLNDFTNIMICTAEDYAISPEFVPYCPSMAELYEMILALQNGG